jgi:small subunit ribosomal protein S18
MPRNSKANKKTNKPRQADGKGRVRRGRPKVCLFCAEHVEWVDYKDINVLRRFTNDRGRIKTRGTTGTCAQHQRDVAVAIKTAREMALMPFAVRQVATEAGRQRGGPRRNRPPAAADAEATTTAAATPPTDAPEAAAAPEAETAPVAS